MRSSTYTIIACAYSDTCSGAHYSIRIAHQRERCRKCKRRVYVETTYQLAVTPPDCESCTRIAARLVNDQARYREECATAQDGVAEHERTRHRDRQIVDALEECARQAKDADEAELTRLHHETAKLLREWWAHPEYIFRDRRYDRGHNYFAGTEQRIRRLMAKSVQREDGVYCQGAFCFKLTPEFEQQVKGVPARSGGELT